MICAPAPVTMKRPLTSRFAISAARILPATSDAESPVATGTLIGVPLLGIPAAVTVTVTLPGDTPAVVGELSVELIPVVERIDTCIEGSFAAAVPLVRITLLPEVVAVKKGKMSG